MARIIKSESEENAENNPLVQKYVKASWGFPDEVLTAGIKVRNKAGGPSMIIVGFSMSTPIPEATFAADSIFWLKSNGYYHTITIYPKIMANIHKKTLIDLGFGESNSTPDYFVFNQLNEDKPHTNGSVYAVVKYWSEKNDDFIHKVISLSELEMLTS